MNPPAPLSPSDLQRLAERAAAGRPSLVLGALPATLPLRPGTLLVRARCDADPRPLGVLRDAAERAAAWMGERFHLGPSAFARRSRRWGMDDPEATLGPARIVETLHRLARQAPRGAVLVLESVESADPATATVLARIADAPGVLGLTVVLAFGAPPRDPLHAQLFERWLRALGRDGVVGSLATEADVAPASAATTAAPEDDALPEAQSAPAAPDSPATPEPPPPAADATRPPAQATDADPLHALGPEGRMTLRAAAIVGPRFDVDTVAALRELSPLRVLEHLQRAADLSLPLSDLGEGRFLLGEALAASLRAELTPSLARAWHQLLGARLAPPPVAHTVFAGPAAPAAPETPPEAPAVDRDAPAATTAPPRVAEAPAPSAATPTAPRESQHPTPTPRAERVQLPMPASHDALRAAEHLAAAGDADGAARALVESARELSLLGLVPESLAQIRRALDTLEPLPPTPARRRLAIEALLARALLQWRGAGPASEFSLAATWETLTAAQDQLRPDDPAGLRGAVASARAGVAVDLGDLAALEEALEALSEAVRALLRDGDAVEAARLLNDQAAVYLRLGDTVRAADLLERARGVFTARIDALPWDKIDPALFAELAAAEHLTAQLPLHVAARAGREADAIALGRSHAMAALERYGRLGDLREAARVRETLARLELRAQRPHKAEEHLLAALATQEQLGDLLGLARSSAALAEACAASGRAEEALRRIGDSLAFNVDKGSALGVAFDRRTVARVREHLGGDAGPLAPRLAQIDAQLREAEQLVGVARLPDDAA